MDKNLLDTLSGNQSRTLSELRSADRAAYDALARTIGEERKRLVVDAVGQLPKQAADAIDRIDPATLAFGPLSDAVNTALTRRKVNARVRGQVLDLLAASSPGDHGDIPTDVPLERVPSLQPTLARAALASFATRARLGGKAVEALVNATDSIESVSDTVVTGLVEGSKLGQVEARQLGLHLSLYHLADGDAAVAHALAGATFKTLGGPLGDARDLARLSTSEIEKALRAAKVSSGTQTPEQQAEAIRRRATNAFPEVTLLGSEPGEQRPTRDLLTRARRVIETNADRFGQTFADLDVSGVPPAEIESVRLAYTELVTLARRYPGLGLESLIVKGGAPKDVAAAVSSRIALIDAVVKANPEVELLAIDYAPDGPDVAKLKMPGLTDKERQAVLSTLKARQRVFAAAVDPDDAMRVSEAGYVGAMSIADDDVETFQLKTGLSMARARQIHQRAEETSNEVMVIIGTIVDLIWGQFIGLPVGNVPPDVTDGLRQIEGYADMFGPQDHCHCEHCSSILSPAAYFVDLMLFVEQHILSKVFVGATASHALNLEMRRPDLWTLELNCANTSDLIPTLDVINEILESYLAKARNPAINLDDRAAIRDLVYQQVLAQVPRSFVLPFVLPVFTADAYLELFDVTRGTIARAFGAAEPRVTAAVLKMARAVYDILIAPNLGQPYLTSLFRVPFAVGGGGAIAAVDVQPFLRGAGITHEQLESLARSSFVRAGTANTLRLVPQKLSTSSVQNDVERITGLNLGVLDRMHRLLRLCAHTGWTLDEVDLVLEHRVAAGAAPVMDPDALRDVATVRELTQTLQLPVDVTCALWSRIPTREVTPGARSLFDRLFNNRPYTLTEGNLPQDTTGFVVPAFRTTPVPGTDNTLQRLLLGLQVDDTGLTALVRGLATALGANPTARDETDRGFRLTLANLTLLYRHATLARLLERPVPDLFRLMSFAGMRSVASIRSLRSLIEFDTWFRGAGLSLDDLAFITGRPVEAADQYPNAVAVTTEVLARVTEENALTFAPTALAFIRTITEDLSRRIFRDNAALFDSVADDRLRLKSTVAPDVAIVTPASMPAALAAQVRTAIMRHHTANVLPAQLATALRISRDKLSALAAMAAIDLGSAEMRAALLGGTRTPLETAVTTLSRLTILFRADAYTTPRLSFMSGNPALFGVASFATLTVPNVQTITRYRDLVTPPIDPAAQARDPQAVDDALVRFTAAQKFASIDPARLGQALAVDTTAAAMLQSAMTLGNDAVEALGALAAMAALVTSTRLDIPTLALLSSEQPADLSAGAEALVSALARLYPDDKDTRLEPKDDRIRSAKRDALTDYTIRESAGRFESLDDLYEYFLLDVQLQGCARTSRVVAAISSLQTYVHRILLNLEQDRRPVGPTHVHILPDQIPEDEWNWRKNYRVWEANRKVFLWPENYIEPEMRDDKTPLFRALEEGLLQQDINEQNVLDAYGAYLAGLEAAGGLTIAGAYHEFNAASQTDVLHLFGATPEDPPEYYYWTITNLNSSRLSAERRVSYSPRRKIEVSIPTRAITPVVYLGRLFVFWTETATSSRHEMLSGNFTFAGYKHQHRIKFTSLRLDGRWVAPQEMRSDGQWLGLGSPDFMRGGVVVDKLGAKGRPAQSISIGGSSVPSQIPFYATDGLQHNEPKDDYSLRGAHWERLACEPIWSSRLFVNYGAYMFNEHADLFDRKFKPNETSVLDGLRTMWAPQRRVLHVGQDGAARRLYAPTSSPNNVLPLAVMSPSAFQNLVADDDTTRFWEGRGYEPTRVSTFVGQLKLTPALRGAPVGTLRITDARATGIGGAAGGTGLVLSAGTDALCVLQDPANGSSGWMGIRIGTTLIRELSQTLFTGGIDLLLDIETQKNLGEGPHLLTTTSGLTILGPAQAGTIDFQGPLGVYYREVFFHIPLLIANHLNGRRNYRAAQDWYHYIFNPTAPPDSDPPMSGLTGTGRTQALQDRVWRYIQFRGLTPLRLRELLRDDDAIEAYKKDPLNPHAIARSRLSAYQKSVVMKYVSNLMDWADSLFSEFTTESINEAMVLYAMASEILGPPPADVGACGEATVTPRNYRKIRSALKRGNEFLLEIETRMAIGTKAPRLRRRSTSSYLSYRRPDNEIAAARFERDTADNATLEKSASRSMTRAADDAGVDRIDQGTLERARMLAGAGALTAGAITTELPIPDMTPGIANQLLREGLDPAPSRQLDWKRTRAVGWEGTRRGARPLFQNDSVLARNHKQAGKVAKAVVRQFGPVFCVPANKDLDKLWARVNDRLYKIRHCLDITGTPRLPALFAPEIDPRLLMRAKAAGISLDDLLGGTSGNLPPYRFAFLIEKAKQFTASVQGFGGQLLSTLEKRDVEELARLRNAQQMNVLKLTTRMREWDVQTATIGYDQLQQQKAAVEYRRDYYVELMTTDLLPFERTQQVVRHMSTEFFVLGAIFGGTAGIVSLIPTLGAPTAIKYGGTELGRSMKGWSTMFSDTAKLLDGMSASIGLEASFERRREGWEHQRQLAELELKQLDRQIAIAALRVQMAERALEMHREAIDDQEEIMDFFRDKFSNAGLYLWLSTSLQRLYRQAFNSAHAMAALAERAFRFERDDETTPLLQPTYWSTQHAGLLSGEGLMTDLLELERRFIETNYRTLELDQSFSVMQIAPAALVALREAGECEVAIPEIAFDLFYPGHYRRRIRAVRLTIPCVTGPYTNVAATLTLKQSFLRRDPAAGDTNLIEMPLRHTPSVATSTAQHDAGVFDFSFRDERYMPFEGAGAVSTWTVSLPKNFRPFDYRTITDVIVHVSYTALADSGLRATVESASATLEGSLTRVLSTTPLPRAVSFRQEFSSTFQRAMASAPGTQVSLEIDDRFLPIFLRGRSFRVSRALILLRTGAGATGAGFSVRLNTQTISGFTASTQFPGHREANATGGLTSGLVGRHTFSIEDGGDLVPSPALALPAAADPVKLADLILYVELTLATNP